MSNRLYSIFHRYYPQILELGSVQRNPWLWDLWQVAPLPEETNTLDLNCIQAVIKKHRIRKFTAKQILDILRSPALQVAPGVTNTCITHVEMLLPRLLLAHKTCQKCEKMIQELIKQFCEPTIDEEGKKHPSDAAILMSFPGIGNIVGATILAEATSLLQTRDLARLRTQCGTAPVTKQSGKSKYVVRRMARNPRLQQAVYHWSRTNVQNDGKSKEHYERLRTAGHSHGRALRGVADRLLSILVSMLRNGQLYDPKKRLGSSG